MKTRKITSTLAAVAIGLSPATPVFADAGDFIAGAIIGGILGANVKQKKRRTGIVSTQSGRDIQASLNYFGFDAGRVDGQLGRRSRAAVSSYQLYLGYVPTGKLTPFEYEVLISSYRRAQIGGSNVGEIIATSPDGVRGLLKSYRAELTGEEIPTAAITDTQEPENTTALPNFLGGQSQYSLASYCNRVSLLTNSNGGFTTVSSMNDANFALSEQFCLARVYAISTGEELINKVQGATPQQIASQCESFGPAMKDQVAALSLLPVADVVRDVSGFILATGMSPIQLSGTAKICLSVGYRTDNLEVALGSALLLFALGDRVYGELLGHHLSQGIGASKRSDLALAWYNASLEALDGGAEPAFAPGQPERNDLIRRATYEISGTGSVGGVDTKNVSLPLFSVDN